MGALTVLSGPVATNGRRNRVKAQQRVLMEYPAPWVTLRPGAVIEKIFWLQAFALHAPGTAFAKPVETAIDLHRPFALEGLPDYETILEQKFRYAESRYRGRAKNPGFEMYPDDVPGTRYVMGWCGQAAAAGYAYLALAERFGLPVMREQAVRSLDVLTTSPVDADGFCVRYDDETDTWSGMA